MLVLTRKLGERLKIGHAITVTVIEIKNGQVRLGIEAPSNIAVHREEVYQRIREQNVRATSEAGRLKDVARSMKQLFRPKGR
ncbi:MAG TPA: carbon storage regulator CsrA [Methylomirabilota bacterium]|nr:carbon storage regulator CsrA [Methylomirabilota bacterium]